MDLCKMVRTLPRRLHNDRLLQCSSAAATKRLHAHTLTLLYQVVGPSHIDHLLDSLDSNTFVKHFLLGNNIIGPRGARRIARFVDEHPNQMETWYLAGNCIDASSFHVLSQAFVNSSAITNVWLKRNPLTSAAAQDMFELVTKAPSLRTLDFDQTSFGDAGLSQLFEKLANHDESVSLRNIYMNGNGMSKSGATQLARYLASPHCQLESLYTSVNPLGNAGVEALAVGLAKNTSLQRLSMESVGMSGAGANALFEVLAQHPTIRALNVGTAYQTGDLGGRFNYLVDDAAHSLCELIFTSRSLCYLDLGYTALSAERYIDIMRAVGGSSTDLVYFSARPGSTDLSRPANYRKMLEGDISIRKSQVFGRLLANVRAAYGHDWTYQRFQREQQRFMMSPPDVRLIDSVYRNRDAGLARRGLKWLEKEWEEGDETLKGVMEA